MFPRIQHAPFRDRRPRRIAEDRIGEIKRLPQGLCRPGLIGRDRGDSHVEAAKRLRVIANIRQLAAAERSPVAPEEDEEERLEADQLAEGSRRAGRVDELDVSGDFALEWRRHGARRSRHASRSYIALMGAHVGMDRGIPWRAAGQASGPEPRLTILSTRQERVQSRASGQISSGILGNWMGSNPADPADPALDSDRADLQREVAEEQREVAEGQRAVAEVQRNVAEEQREVAEDQREVAEGQRSVAEESRLTEEGLRRVAEYTRDAAEQLRRNAEHARQAAEEARDVASGLRARDESAAAAEALRGPIADQKRGSNDPGATAKKPQGPSFDKRDAN